MQVLGVLWKRFVRKIPYFWVLRQMVGVATFANN